MHQLSLVSSHSSGEIVISRDFNSRRSSPGLQGAHDLLPRNVGSAQQGLLLVSNVVKGPVNGLRIDSLARVGLIVIGCSEWVLTELVYNTQVNHLRRNIGAKSQFVLALHFLTHGRLKHPRPRRVDAGSADLFSLLLQFLIKLQSLESVDRLFFLLLLNQ